VWCAVAGLGVAKFLVQLGVFASVLYTLLALDIDPVEQLVKLLPISDVRKDTSGTSAYAVELTNCLLPWLPVATCATLTLHANPAVPTE
jgi:hypothetical protein